MTGEEKSSCAKCRILFLSPSLPLRPNEIVQFILKDIIKNQSTRVLLYCYYYVPSFRHIVIVAVNFVLSVYSRFSSLSARRWRIHIIPVFGLDTLETVWIEIIDKNSNFSRWINKCIIRFRGSTVKSVDFLNTIKNYQLKVYDNL